MGLFGSKFPADKKGRKLESELLKLMGEGHRERLRKMVSDISYIESSLMGVSDSLQNNEISVAKVQLNKAAETIREVIAALAQYSETVTGDPDQKKAQKALKLVGELQELVTELDKKEKGYRT